MFDANWVPLRLSLQVTLSATLLVLLTGVPLGWLLARKHFPGRDALGAFAMLPLVLPPTVLGYYLLVTLGAQSPLGRWLASIGFPLVFTWRGAVIAASIAAFPLMVESVRTGFEGVDPRLEGGAHAGSFGVGDLLARDAAVGLAQHCGGDRAHLCAGAG